LPFLDFGIVLSPIGINLRKLSTGAQLQTFPYLTASKSVLYSNTFMAKSGAQSLMLKSVTNRQIDRKKRFWPSRRRVKSEPPPIKLGMVIEDLEHILAPRKLLGDLMHGFAAIGALKIWG